MVFCSFFCLLFLCTGQKIDVGGTIMLSPLNFELSKAKIQQKNSKIQKFQGLLGDEKKILNNGLINKIEEFSSLKSNFLLNKAVIRFLNWDINQEERFKYYIVGVSKFEKEIFMASMLHELPVSLIKAVISVESSWDMYARSKTGAEGLMQLNHVTQKEMFVKNPFDPVENISRGTEYLKRMCIMFGSIELGLVAYKIGPTKLRKKIKKNGRSVPSEARAYVKKVLFLYYCNC